MKRILFYLLFCLPLAACEADYAEAPRTSASEARVTRIQPVPVQSCAKPDSGTCDEAARCVVVECTEDPYSPFAGACKDPTSDGCLKCARWARTVSMCRYLFERCNNGL